MDIKQDDTLFNEGNFILFTQGDYSDFHPTGLFKVLKTFDMASVEIPVEPDSSGGYNVAKHDKAVAKMLRDGLIEELDYREVNADPYKPVWYYY